MMGILTVQLESKYKSRLITRILGENAHEASPHA